MSLLTFQSLPFPCPHPQPPNLPPLISHYHSSWLLQPNPLPPASWGPSLRLSLACLSAHFL